MMTVAGPRTCFGVSLINFPILAGVLPGLTSRFERHILTCRACIQMFRLLARPPQVRIDSHPGRIDGRTLARLIANQMPAEEETTIEAHLAGCYDCAERSAEMATEYQRCVQFLQRHNPH